MKVCGRDLFPLGIGTFGMGGFFKPDRSGEARWKAAIKFALRRGYELVDTAEVYGGGYTERLVGEALEGTPFVVSKLDPGSPDLVRSAERSKRLLGRIDLLMLHAPPADIEEGIRALEECVDRGIVGSIGVSNFGIDQLELALSLTKRHELSAVQDELNLAVQKLELKEFCDREGLAYLAYSPLGRGDLFRHPAFTEVKRVAQGLGKTPAQVALRWVLDTGALAIVKAERPEHIVENLGAVGWSLGRDWARLGKAFKNEGTE